MGCGNSRTTEDTIDPTLLPGTAYNSLEFLDFSKNPNRYISENKNYYKNQKPKTPFQDDLFPPNNESFYGKEPNESRRDKSLNEIKSKISENQIEWKHIKEIWPEGKIFNEKITLNDIKLGEISNAYLVASLTALSEYPRLILQLFKTLELKEDSAIEVGMKINGEWKIICIDDYFPINKNTNKPIFSDSPTNALWGVILEKVYAKINGGYGNIIFGYSQEVFETLTPFNIIPIDVSKENKISFWKNIKESGAYKLIMTGTIEEKIKEDCEKVGLIANHTFSLVDAYEREIGGEKVKLIKLRNPFGFGEWNGDWSDKSDKWDEEARMKFNYNEYDINDGIFFIDYDNFCKYFNKVCICVPLSPLYSTNINIDKNNADKFNVIKIKIPELDDKGKLICSIKIYSQSYRFDRSINPDENVNENLILAKVEKKKFVYYDSSFNEGISNEVTPGEYIIIANLNYKTTKVKPKDYIINIACTKHFQWSLMEPDEDLSLIKDIIINKVETLSKYKSRFKNMIVIFTGNRFENSGIAFFYIQNKGDEIYFKPRIYFKNIDSIEGEIPNLKLKKKDKYVYLGIRKNNEQYQAAVNGDVSGEIDDAYEPVVNEEHINYYLGECDYQEMNVNFAFEQF